VQVPRSQPSSAQIHAVYRDNVDAVFAFFAYTLDGSTAEELTAATFERVVRSWHRFDANRAAVRTWILAIARNILLDHHRRQRFRVGPSLDAAPELADRMVDHDHPGTSVLREEGLWRLLGPLSPRQREVLALEYGADLATRDIASCMGITESQVYDLRSRALRRLRDTVDRAGVMDTV
jgi:RNA polymerase sigma-70 factor (ECF subfamily)